MRRKRNKDLYKITIEILGYEHLKLRAKSPDEALALAKRYLQENKIEFNLTPERMTITNIKRNNNIYWEDLELE